MRIAWAAVSCVLVLVARPAFAYCTEPSAPYCEGMGHLKIKTNFADASARWNLIKAKRKISFHAPSARPTILFQHSNENRTV